MSKARKDDYLQMDKTDPDVAKRIRGEVSRLQRRVPMLDGRHYLARFENVIIAYLNTNRDAEYHPAMVSLCAPFIYVLDEEWDAYYCFEQVMQALGEDLYICLSKHSFNTLHTYIHRRALYHEYYGQRKRCQVYDPLPLYTARIASIPSI